MSTNDLLSALEGFPDLQAQAVKLGEALADLEALVENNPVPAGDAAESDGGLFQETKAALETLQGEHANLQGIRVELENALAQERKAHEATKAAVPESEAAPDTAAFEALQSEVSHWKSKYDALGVRFDTEIEAAKASAEPAAPAVDTSQLEAANEKAAAEIARLAEELAAARKETDEARMQLSDVNTKLEGVQQQLATDTPEEGPDLSAELETMKTQVETLNTELETARRDAIAAKGRADASETARNQAAARLKTLIDSLNSAAA